MSTDSNSEQEQFSNIDTDTFCDYCGGNDEDPQDHCMDCTRPEQQPVGEMISNDGDIYWTDSHPHMGMKLYTAPPPAKLRPIAEAPKDGTVILAWCDHEAASYYCDKTGRLSAYGANAEGMSHVDNGWNLIRWEEGFFDGECHLPAWWFLADGCGETAANPVLWVALPANPKPEDFPGTDNSLVVDDKVLSPAQQAGEREAFEAWWKLDAEGSENKAAAYEGWKARAAYAQGAPANEREGFRSWCESIGYPAALMTCGDLAAFQAGAAWQRTQAAGGAGCVCDGPRAF